MPMLPILQLLLRTQERRDYISGEAGYAQARGPAMASVFSQMNSLSMWLQLYSPAILYNAVRSSGVVSGESGPGLTD